MKLPPVRGQITFEGLAATNFFIRMFQLEEYVAFAQAKVNEKPDNIRASVPIISEHVVDEERLVFYFAIALEVDALGIQSGIGSVFYSDRENRELVIAQRDKLADAMMDMLAKNPKSKSFEKYVVPPGKDKST